MAINVISAKFREVPPAFHELLYQHWMEVGYSRDEINLNIDWDAYNRMDDAGNLSTILVYNSDNTLIGYCIDFVHDHIHHKGTKYAVNDAFYVHPAYRKTHVPVEILKVVQLYLKEVGARTHMITMMESHRWDKTAQAAGYKQVETVHAIDLTEVGE